MIIDPCFRVHLFHVLFRIGGTLVGHHFLGADHPIKKIILTSINIRLRLKLSSIKHMILSHKWRCIVHIIHHRTMSLSYWVVISRCHVVIVVCFNYVQIQHLLIVIVVYGAVILACCHYEFLVVVVGCFIHVLVGIGFVPGAQSARSICECIFFYWWNACGFLFYCFL